jgi:hypothetical protein
MRLANFDKDHWQLQENPDSRSMEIERINKQLWAKPDNLDKRLSDYAKRHNLIPNADTTR